MDQQLEGAPSDAMNEFNRNIPWEQGVDLQKKLLPVKRKGRILESLTQDEEHAFSWALGLLACSAIKEHEKILNELRPVAYPEGKLEGLAFFLEEAVHAATFEKFLSHSATALNLKPHELSSFLPHYRKESLLTRIYETEAKLKGNAIWWTVAATEEESIRLYQEIQPQKNDIDPVFYKLNQAHFLEESRHSSFSYKMIKEKKDFLGKFSFALSRVLQTIWLIKELSAFKNVRNYRHRHPMLESMAKVSEKIEALNMKEKITLLFSEISYTQMLSRPENHPRINRAIRSEKVIMLRLPEAK